MSTDEDAEIEQARLAQEQVRQLAAREIALTEPIYTHAINALWAGNGTASLAVLAAISATVKADRIDKRALVPLFFFLSGLICMYVGTLRTLIRASAAARAKERATSVFDYPADYVRSPSEEAGLAFNHPRTLGAILSGVCFVLGCVSGFLLLLFS